MTATINGNVMKMNIIFFGPPGSGKGTYASKICPQLGIPHISTGDIFRAEIAKQSSLGKKVEPILKVGGLVDDKIVMEIIKHRLAEPDCKKGFVFDGFPRTLEQANEFQKIANIDLVIHLVLADEIILEKALARRICEKCGAIYNIADINRNGIKMPPLLPKVKGKCDKCDSNIIQRKDDNEATIRDRLETYKKQTEPLIKYYNKEKIIKDVAVVAGPDVMVPKISSIINNWFSKK